MSATIKKYFCNECPGELCQLTIKLSEATVSSGTVVTLKHCPVITGEGIAVWQVNNWWQSVRPYRAPRVKMTGFWVGAPLLALAVVLSVYGADLFEWFMNNCETILSGVAM